MSLTCERLMMFDLFEEAEKNIKSTLLLRFFSIFQEIESIDQFIKDSPSFPGSTDKIIRGELINVVGSTLSIEGTVLNEEEIEESFKKAEEGKPLLRKEQEAENSRKVYEFIKDYISRCKDDFEYSEAVIKQIHSYLTEGLNYLSNIPGQYRSNFITTFGEPRKQGLCRTQSEIEEAMQKFVNWLNMKSKGIMSQNIFVKAIMAHYYLTEIHPFGDGNGRTARALEALVLDANGVNDYCFWSLANFWSLHKDQYLEHLHNIRITLNPTDFIIWGLEGYRDEIKRLKDKVLKKVRQLMLSDYVHYLLRNKKYEKIKINHRIVDIIQLLIIKGKIPAVKFLSSPELVALYRNISTTTRMRDFQKMILKDLIKIDKSNGEDFIELNFQILERISYNV
jgi:Fic family protein